MRVLTCLLVMLAAGEAFSQQPPYDTFPAAEPPWFRVRFEASSAPGELTFPSSFTVWLPPEVTELRGVIVHQHGCGEGSCKSGLTGAYDLHWQALAEKHHCALLSPVFEQPETGNCQMWCDPRNGSDRTFRRALAALAETTGHPELVRVPWALWGHSGGGHWAGGMTLLHPDRIVAAWLRSGVPPLKAMEGRPAPWGTPHGSTLVPIMCNVGTKEGVTDKEGRFAGVWPGVKVFFEEMRRRNSLCGVAVDPLSSHECGNQRYLAIPWLDACLTARLPATTGSPLQPMSAENSWLAELSIDNPTLATAVPARTFSGETATSVWLPDEATAVAWKQYVKDTVVGDNSSPPAPTDLRIAGQQLRWNCRADLESGLATFVIERDGQQIATVPETDKNPFGRPIFQQNSYSDTPTQPLMQMQWIDSTAEPGKGHRYRVYAVNTVGLKSEPSAEVSSRIIR